MIWTTFQKSEMAAANRKCMENGYFVRLVTTITGNSRNTAHIQMFMSSSGHFDGPSERLLLTGLISAISRTSVSTARSDTILDHPSALPPPSAAAASVAKCTTCIRESYGKGYKKAKYSANKVKQRCIKCQRPTCKKHSTTSVVCESCTG